MPLGLTEFLNLRQFVVQERADKPVQLPVPGHIHPHRLIAVLDQDCGLRVLKDDVVGRIAPVKLALYLNVQVVVAVFSLPVAARHAKGVLDGAVGPVAPGNVKLVDQGQLLPVVAAVGI